MTTTQTTSPKRSLRSEDLKGPQWFPEPPAAREETLAAALVKLSIGVAVGAVFFALGARKLAIVVWVIAGLIGLVSLGSRRGRTGIARAFGAVGYFVGHWLAIIIMVPVYLVGFTAARVFMRLSGNDPLHLRDGDRPTYWLECDRDERKVRYVRSMFTTEAPVAGGRRLLPLVAGLIALVVLAEVLLRFMGYGNPIVYRSDAQIGYLTAPNQEARRSGGNVFINEFGMRSPPVTKAKDPNTFRVFMLGDSTLYGGSYIDQEDLYARRLEKLLSERSNGRKVEVVAMGVNGWGPFHELGYLERYGAFNADVAIVCLPYGDIYRPLGGLEGKPFLPDSKRGAFALTEVVHHLLWRLQATQIGEPSQADQDYLAPRGIAAYVELCKKLRAAGCEVYFEVLPMSRASDEKKRSDEARRVPELSAGLKSSDVPVDFPVDLLDHHAYHDGVHLSNEGHRLYADYLAKHIAETSKRFADWKAAR